MVNDVVFLGDKRMTVKEVADALNVSAQTIRSWTRKLFPNIIRNGFPTYLSEDQAIAIKRMIGSGRNDLPNISSVQSITTDSEMAEKAREVMAWLTTKVVDLETKIIHDAPKVESFDALMVSDSCMSITDAAKHFELHRSDVFAYLRSHKYLTLCDIPSQAAIDANYLTLKEDMDTNGKVRPRAVVLQCQLETWRTRVAPQVREWLKA